ncbi:MAG: multiubiquitin domain-containing protein [Prevotellaceae bacterium]|nr:multiubiquitin domain-containing protein [Prevotellaceae bacterium]
MFETEQQFLNGEEIKKMAGIPLEYELHLYGSKVKDQLVNNNTKVDLGMPGLEKFTSIKPIKNKLVIVNGRPHDYSEKTITYDQVVRMAYPDDPAGKEMGYTVSYSNGPIENPEGPMTKGSTVIVKHNMKFYVTATHKS